jgi:hypothetical protein
MELQRSSASREGYKGKDRSWAEERIRLLEEENAKLRKELEYARKNTMTEGSNNDEVNISWDQERREEDDSDSVKKPTSSLSFEGKLTRSQIERYSRQLLLHRGFGVEGQLELLKSSVLVIGAGGIGSTGTYNRTEHYDAERCTTTNISSRRLHHGSREYNNSHLVSSGMWCGEYNYFGF